MKGKFTHSDLSVYRYVSGFLGQIIQDVCQMETHLSDFDYKSDQVASKDLTERVEQVSARGSVEIRGITLFFRLLFTIKFTFGVNMGVKGTPVIVAMSKKRVSHSCSLNRNSVFYRMRHPGISSAQDELEYAGSDSDKATFRRFITGALESHRQEMDERADADRRM